MVGVVGVLIAVLLPTLAEARRSARLTRDLSNQRQLAAAVIAFAGDKGVTPTVSTTQAAWEADRGRNAFRTAYDPQTGHLRPWYQTLDRYLDGDPADLVVCPEDEGLEQGGYLRAGGPATDRVMASYALNADLAAVNTPLDGGPLRARLGPEVGDFIGVYAAADLYPGEQHHGESAGGRLTRVYDATRTLLLADCGVRRPVPADVGYLDRPDVLAYTTNYAAYNDADPAAWGTLAGVMQTPWLAARVPLRRHDPRAVNALGNLAPDDPPPGVAPFGRGGRLPIAFADAHAEVVPRGRFGRVKVTPFPLRPLP